MSEASNWNAIDIYHPKDLCIVGQEIYKLRLFDSMGRQINYSVDEFPRDNGDKWEKVTNTFNQ